MKPGDSPERTPKTRSSSSANLARVKDGSSVDSDSVATEACRAKLENINMKSSNSLNTTSTTPKVTRPVVTPKNMIVKNSYKGGQDSPGENVEFQVKVGDMVKMMSTHEDQPQWAYIQKESGQCGYVPLDFLHVSTF